MTINEFYANYAKYGTTVKVVSAFNGKVLCKDFNPKKHTNIGERELSGVYTEISAKENFAKAVLCLYADGAIEYEQHCKQR